MEGGPSYRSVAQTTINRVRQENPGATKKELRLLLRDAYPFGSTRNHALRVWVTEVGKALKQVER
jgi:hypothetical protein